MNINEARLYGRLTRDPELKTLPNGTYVCNFSVATNKTYNDRDGKRQEKTDYHNVVVFGKMAETIAQYVRKGETIYVEGSMETRSWEKDGVKHYRTEVRADRFQFGDGNRKEKSAKEQNDDEMPEYPEEDINPEDIPF